MYVSHQVQLNIAFTGTGLVVLASNNTANQLHIKLKYIH